MDDTLKRVIGIIRDEDMGFYQILTVALTAADSDEAAILIKAFPDLWEDVKPS